MRVKPFWFRFIGFKPLSFISGFIIQDNPGLSRNFLPDQRKRSGGMTCRGVFPFNHTGYIRHGASPSPGLEWRWVNAATLRIPLYVTGVAAAICRHPAARPEPWYVCIRIVPRGQPLAGAGWRWVNAATVGVPCIGSYRSTPQVICPTWRAAGCRPYSKIVTNTVYLTYQMSVLCSKYAKNVVRYRRGGKYNPFC